MVPGALTDTSGALVPGTIQAEVLLIPLVKSTIFRPIQDLMCLDLKRVT